MWNHISGICPVLKRSWKQVNITRIDKLGHVVNSITGQTPIFYSWSASIFRMVAGRFQCTNDRVSSHRPKRPVVYIWWFITIISTNVTTVTAIVRCIEGKRVKYRAPFISFDSWMKISSSVREFLIFFSQISSIEIMSRCEMSMVPKWSIRTNLNKASFGK